MTRVGRSRRLMHRDRPPKAKAWTRRSARPSVWPTWWSAMARPTGRTPSAQGRSTLGQPCRPKSTPRRTPRPSGRSWRERRRTSSRPGRPPSGAIASRDSSKRLKTPPKPGRKLPVRRPQAALSRRVPRLGSCYPSGSPTRSVGPRRPRSGRDVSGRRFRCHRPVRIGTSVEVPRPLERGSAPGGVPSASFLRGANLNGTTRGGCRRIAAAPSTILRDVSAEAYFGLAY
jgi:hypothetical protein